MSSAAAAAAGTQRPQMLPPPRKPSSAARSGPPPGASGGTNIEPIPKTPTLQLRYRLSPRTYTHLVTIPHSPTRRQVLETACHAQEFTSFPIRPSEKSFFRDINESKPIPYLLREPLGTNPWHKPFLLVQIDLLKTGWPNKLSSAVRKELQAERGKMYGVLNQTLRCLVDILGERRDGKGVSVALDVLRSVLGGAWEGNGMELLQVEGIGMARMKKLVAAGVRNVRQLANMEFYHIERVLSRNPPFGQNILRQVKDFPYLQLKLDIIPGQQQSPEEDLQKQWAARVLLSYDNEELPKWNKTHPWTTLVIEGKDGRLVWFWRGSVKSMKDGGKDIIFQMEAEKGEEMKVTFACEGIVGALCRGTFNV